MAALNTVAGALGMASRIGKLANAQQTLQQAKASGNGPVNGSSPAPNKNLSMTQFGQKAHVVSEAARVAHSALGTNSSVPSIGEPGFAPTNSIPSNLYSS